MKKTGEKFKAAREKLGVSLIEVSMATKINLKVLAAMEAGDEAQLPARTFLRGFIRSYASYLKLDPEATLKAYQEESIVDQPVIQTKESTVSSALPDIEKRARTIKAIAISAIGILILVILLLRNLMEKYERERQTDPAPISSPVSSATPLISESPITIPIEPTPIPTPTLTPKPEVVAKVEAPKPEPKPSSAPKKRDVENEIIFEALDKVTLKFQVNGGDVTEITLQPDQVHTIKTKGVVHVEASDGGAIDIIINGRDTGVPGDLGKPKTIKLP